MFAVCGAAPARAVVNPKMNQNERAEFEQTAMFPRYAYSLPEMTCNCSVTFWPAAKWTICPFVS
jgi:hypothetical protein